MSLHVCSGSIASVWRRPNHFRFPPDSDRIADIAPCPKGAKSGVRAPPLLVNVMDAASEKSPCHAFTDTDLFAKIIVVGRLHEVVTPYLQPAPSMCRSVSRGLPL